MISDKKERETRYGAAELVFGAAAQAERNPGDE